MGRTAGRALGARAKERDARIAKARAQRLALDKDREEREGRIDAAVADVYLAQGELDQALKAVAVAEARMGTAITSVLGLGVSLAQVAKLTQLSAVRVQKLRTPVSQRHRSAIDGKELTLVGGDSHA